MRPLMPSELFALIDIFDALEITIWIAASVVVVGATIKHYCYRRYL